MNRINHTPERITRVFSTGEGSFGYVSEYGRADLKFNASDFTTKGGTKLELSRSHIGRNVTYEHGGLGARNVRLID